MNPNPQENRREPRRNATGAVKVWFEDPKRYEIQGELMDLSTSGFRMTHECRELCTGQVVQFSHLEAAGRAKVVWNRILTAHVESGFLVFG
jgi:hypothetical protein